jgi:hypothetical protein
VESISEMRQQNSILDGNGDMPLFMGSLPLDDPIDRLYRTDLMHGDPSWDGNQQSALPMNSLSQSTYLAPRTPPKSNYLNIKILYTRQNSK